MCLFEQYALISCIPIARDGTYCYYSPSPAICNPWDGECIATYSWTLLSAQHS